MANDLEQLVLAISADTRQIQRALKRMESDVGSTVSRSEKSFQKLDARFRSIGVSASAAAASLTAAFAGAVSVQKIIQLSDSYTGMQNALRVAGLEGQVLAGVFEQLFAAAQRNYTPTSALVDLYSKIALNQKELGVTSEQLISFTDNVAKALRVGGTNATEASGALLQLSQSMGAGVVRAEEFNSILEGAPTILQAAAAGIKQAEGSVAKLRQIMLDGGLSSKALFDGIEAGSGLLDQRLSGAVATVSQSLTALQNEMEKAVGRLNEGSGASKDLTDAVNDLSAKIAETDFTPFVSGVVAFARSLADTVGTVSHYADELGRLSGAQKLMQSLRAGAARDAVVSVLGASPLDRVDTAFDRAGSSGGGLTAAQLLASRGVKSAPAGGSASSRTAAGAIDVTSAKYRAAGSGGSSGGAGSRGGKSEADQQMERQQRVIDSLKFEAEQLGRTNREQAIYNELRSAGTTLNTQAGQTIAEIAGKNYDLAEAQRRANESMEEMRYLAESSLSGFVSDLREGKSAAEALGGVLDQIADKLIDMAVQNLVANAFGGAAGGGIGGFISGLFGRAGGGPVRAGVPVQVGEQGRELFVPQTAGRIIPNHKIEAARTPPEPAHVMVSILSGEMFDARVQQVSGAVAATVVRQNNKAMPAMMADAQRRQG